MRNFWRDLFYAVATGALIGTIIRQRRERREAQARAAYAVPPVIARPQVRAALATRPRRWRRWRRRPRRRERIN
jgi:hypothetical protein